MNNLYIGVDIGKRHDPTAIVVADVEARHVGDQITGRWESHYVVPFLMRLELETPYPDQVKQLMNIIVGAIRQFRKAHIGDLSPVRIMVDVTGVGDAVTDMLVQAGVQKLGALYPCRFVGGDHLGKHGRDYLIGKSHFVSRMQVVSESKKIHLPPSYSEAAALAQEMLDFDIDVDEMSGKATYGAMRPGTHDDLVTALGLVCLVDPLKHVRSNPLAGSAANWL